MDQGNLVKKPEKYSVRWNQVQYVTIKDKGGKMGEGDQKVKLPFIK